jgi:tRNA threonylcarbamoyladenosine biosynthesis protein TsaB
VIVLGFDTATPATAAALLGPGGSVVEARDDPPPQARPRHTTALLRLATELLQGAGIGFSELDLIAVGTGPGTFTGLRIGIATARALAQGAGVDLVGVSTLHALAEAASDVHPDGPVAALIDARRGELFVAGYARGERLIGPLALAPDDVGPALSTVTPAGSPPWLGVGDGALRFQSVLESAGVAVALEDSALHRVSAAVVCRLAASGQADARDAVTPEYVRPPDAELPRRK